MVDGSMVMMDWLPSMVHVLGVVRVMVGKVGGAQDGMLSEFDRLYIVLVVETVVQLRVVALVLAIMSSAIGQEMLQVTQFVAGWSRVAVAVLLRLTDDGEVVMTLLRNYFVLLSIVVILSFLMVHWLLVMSEKGQF